MRRVVTCTALAGVLLAGCTTGSEIAQPTAAEPPATSQSPSPTPSTTGKSLIIEQAFLTREPLKSCGTLDQPLGDTDRKAAEKSLDCLSQAFSQGEGAELLVIDYTVEGDPIRSYYRALPDEHGYELFVDGTDDAFGTARWQSPPCDEVLLRAGQVTCLTRVININ